MDSSSSLPPAEQSLGFTERSRTKTFYISQEELAARLLVAQRRYQQLLQVRQSIEEERQVFVAAAQGLRIVYGRLASTVRAKKSILELRQSVLGSPQVKQSVKDYLFSAADSFNTWLERNRDLYGQSQARVELLLSLFKEVKQKQEAVVSLVYNRSKLNSEQQTKHSGFRREVNRAQSEARTLAQELICSQQQLKQLSGQAQTLRQSLQGLKGSILAAEEQVISIVQRNQEKGSFRKDRRRNDCLITVEVLGKKLNQACLEYKERFCELAESCSC